jgi:N-acetylglucosamine-6-phosphate deacetylase
MNKRYAFVSGRILLENGWLHDGYVVWENGTIVEVGEMNDFHEDEKTIQIKIPDGSSIVPGFIDVHIHGASGADTMDGTKEALRTMGKALPKEGTTSFLATTMTTSSEAIERALINVAEDEALEGEAELLGVHLEGPFIAPNRVGAQHPRYVQAPNAELFVRWQEMANGRIRLVTFAPEQKEGMAFLRTLCEHGVTASIGHSDANDEKALQAIEQGVTHCTHLFNGMRSLHHRQPNALGAMLLDERVRCELIVDGLHVHPHIVKLAYRLKGKDGIVLITDAMRAKGLGDGVYDLGGQEVKVVGNQATLLDGTLAGSVLKMNEAIRNMCLFTGCSLDEAIRMATINPAKQIGVADRKGSIAVGKDADLVVINDQCDVWMTICRGHIAYRKEGGIH